MTLRIDRHASGDRVVLRLIGKLGAEHIGEVQAEIAECGRVELDIGDLTLVSVEGIRFLNACQDAGIDIVSACLYVSDWMLLERGSGPPRD